MCKCEIEHTIYDLKCDFCKLIFKLTKLIEAIELANKIKLEGLEQWS